MTDPHVDVDAMLALAEDAIAAFDDPDDLARAWNQVAHVRWTRGRFGETREALETALRHVHGDQRERSDILRRLARVAVIGPTPVDEAIARCREIMADDEHDVILTAVCETMLAVLWAMRGEIALARELYGASKRRLRDLGSGVNLAGLQMYCGLAELIAGDPAAAERELREGYDALEQMHERGRLSTIAALLARACFDQGRLDDAERFTAVSKETAIGDDVVSRALWRSTRARVLAHRGELAQAQELAREAVAIAGSSDFIVLHAGVLTDLAEVLGDGEEARAALEHAMALSRKKGDVSPRSSRLNGGGLNAAAAHRAHVQER
jgi:ATP/maltotriose-dependent transcriptional regulator MalT